MMTLGAIGKSPVEVDEDGWPVAGAWGLPCAHRALWL